MNSLSITQAPYLDSDISHDLESELIDQNIAAMHDFYMCEESKRSAGQRHAEVISDFVGQHVFLFATLVFVVLWICINVCLPFGEQIAFDKPPFHWLQGILALGVVVMNTSLTPERALAVLGEELISRGGSVSASTISTTPVSS